jgi:hypothetical protein
MPPAATRIADLADRIAARRRVYDEALAADMRRLAKAHGDGPLRDALRLLDKQHPAREVWNRAEHQRG